VGPVQAWRDGRGLAFWERGEVFHFDTGGFAVFALNRLVDLLAVHRDRGRGGDSEADLVAADIDDGDFDIVADHDGFIALPRKYEHLWAPSQCQGRELLFTGS
jgi:hypothetical protein